MSHAAQLSEPDFGRIRSLLKRESGISLAEHKSDMVVSRLKRRLAQLDLPDFAAYVNLIGSPAGAAELALAVDLLTTNETYFFREPAHFDRLAELARAHRGVEPFRCWSAAGSSGEEAYTIAMVLEETLGQQPWEVWATDISQRMLETAAAGCYPLERARHVPPALLKRHCLKGFGPEEGRLLVRRELRRRVRFLHANLAAERLPDLPMFDVIFLRNVLIYFDTGVKRTVVGGVAQRLRRGGTLFVSHTETLNGVVDSLRTRSPSVYEKP